MGILNYVVYARALEKGMSRSNMSREATELFGFIVNCEYVLNKNGEPYDINNRVAREWYKGLTDIPQLIKEAAADDIIRKAAPKHFDKVIATQLLIPQKEADALSAVLLAVDNDTHMAPETRRCFHDLYDSGNKYSFLAETFLYAITKDNTFVEHDMVPSLEDEIGALRVLLTKLQKPGTRTPPEKIQPEEMTYVAALLEAYAQALGLNSIRQDELQPQFRKHFDRQRKDYYAAESIRESTRDTQFLRDRNDFDSLKDETLAAVIDVYEQVFTNGYARLVRVLQQASVAPLSSLLATIPGWITASEKKGVCHMLVNDGKMRWIDDDTL